VLICPDPKNEEQYIKFLLDYVRKEPVDVLVPVGYTSTITISRHKEELLPFVKIPVAGNNSMEIAGNKEKTIRLADSLNVLTPKMYASITDIETFPVVAKWIYETGGVKYLHSFDEIRRLDLKDYILQEYIPGEGYGFFALFNQGDVRAFFMHKRIREIPICGGRSTCAESIFDEDLKKAGLELLQSLRWHGIAMVEFKKDSRDGKYKLMEINPKFWGSLGLSIASGVNFPVLLVNMAINGDIDPVYDYKSFVRYRWPYPDDILHFLEKPQSIGEILRESFSYYLKSDLWLEDFWPNALQICRTIPMVKQKIFHRKSSVK
jgi:predicted ATP-grasp superfamily ATP-dependent carboligase